MNLEQQLQQRQQAREAKRQIDDQLLALHRLAVAGLLDPFKAQHIRAQALARVQIWQQRLLCNQHYIDAWRAILALPEAELPHAILRNDDQGVALRQNTPFGFLTGQA